MSEPSEIMGAGDNPSNLERLKKLIEGDNADEAITLMGRLNTDEIRTVLKSNVYRELAINAFNNDKMFRAVKAMGRKIGENLYLGLIWMFEEGTDWPKVRDIIRGATEAGKERVRASKEIKDRFISLCNDEEMTEAVDLLGGTLLWKLSWMYAEAVTDWAKIKAKIEGVTEDQKKQVRENAVMKRYFIYALNDEEMTEAVDLLGGTLYWKLQWLKAQGVSGKWVKKTIQAAVDKDPQKDPKKVAHDLINAFKKDTSSPQAFPKLNKKALLKAYRVQ